MIIDIQYNRTSTLVKEIFIQEDLKPIYAKIVIATFVLLFLILKNGYSLFIKKKSTYSSELKKSLHVLIGLYLIFTLVPLYWATQGNALFSIMVDFIFFSEFIKFILLIIIICLMFYYIIKKLDSLNDNNQKKKNEQLYHEKQKVQYYITSKSKALFFCLALIPNLILTVLGMTVIWSNEEDRVNRHRDHNNTIDFYNIILNIYTYCLMFTSTVILIFHFVCLVHFLKKRSQDSKFKNNFKFVFSTSILSCLLLIFQTFSVHIVPLTSIKWIYFFVNMTFIILFIIYVHPIKFRDIVEYKNNKKNEPKQNPKDIPLCLLTHSQGLPQIYAN